jgi:cytoskeletal protein RodZ
MSKSSITWIIVAVVIVIIALGWWIIGSMNQPSVTPTTTQSSEKSISSFTLSGLNPVVNGTIDNTNYTVSLTVPTGTDLTTLVPTISVSDSATVSPVSDVAQDFTNPVTYTVTAQDGSTQNYTVTVTAATSTPAPAAQ